VDDPDWYVRDLSEESYREVDSAIFAYYRVRFRALGESMPSMNEFQTTIGGSNY
jgi:hypothetical protein